MKISDGRTRMSLDLHQSPSRTMRDGPSDLLKRIAYLIPLPSQKSYRAFTDLSCALVL